MKHIVWLMAVLLVACSSGLDQKLDASSEKAFESSLARMKKSSSQDEIRALDDALLVLALSDVSIGYEGGILVALQKLAAHKTPEQLADALIPQVNGKTGRALIADGAKRKMAEATRQLEQLEKEMAQLHRLRDEKSVANAALDQIRIIEPTLRFNGIGPQKLSVMDFKVKNGTNVPLGYLYLRGTASAAVGGRILFSDDINYKLSEAVAPGATKEIRLPYSNPGKWNAPEIWGRNDILFRIDVVNAETDQRQKLAAAFTHRDGERLALLEKQKPELQKIVSQK